MLTCRVPRFVVSSSLVAIGWVGLSPDAVAQHTPDPYNIVGEYNSQYEPFLYAIQPNNDGVIPNQNRMQERAGNRSANRFRNFSDSLDGGEPDQEFAGSLRRSGPGTPYYQAYRRYDQDFNRLYRPNKDADSSYYKQQDGRNLRYIEAMQQTDPRKRAQLLREYNMDNLRAARGLSTSRNSPERVRSSATPAALDADLLPENPRAPTRSRAASPAPAARGRVTTSPGVNSARTPALDSDPLSTTLPPIGSRVRGRTAGPHAPSPDSPSEVLDRSTVLERATRATAPRARTAPRTTAPPPR